MSIAYLYHIPEGFIVEIGFEDAPGMLPVAAAEPSAIEKSLLERAEATEASIGLTAVRIKDTDVKEILKDITSACAEVHFVADPRTAIKKPFIKNGSAY